MKIFETVSFHIVKPCNFKCKYCYATFEDLGKHKMLSYEESCTIISKLCYAGVKKITFAGGEPMLYPYLQDCIKFAKSLGMTTSIITNGSLIKKQFLIDMLTYLDWIGISIDSIESTKNDRIGRFNQIPLDYEMIIDYIHKYGYKLKINTVVNKYNCNQNMQKFINYANPERWKVFETLRVEGQNDKQYDEIRCTNDEFKAFIERHNHTSMVVEDNAAMTGSYLLVDPLGRLFENSQGKHTYSDPLQTNDIEHCLSQINLDRDMFIERGGIYNW